MTITATPAAAPMTTVHGFAVQILAFIPIPKDDLKRQIEVSQALIDLGEGTKTIADLVPFMKGVEFRQQHVGKRVTVEEANSWKAQAQLPLDEQTAEEKDAEAEEASQPEPKAAKGKGKAKPPADADEDFDDIDPADMDGGDD